MRIVGITFAAVVAALGIAPHSYADNVPRLQGDKFSKLLSFSGEESTDPHFLGTSDEWSIRGWVNKTTFETSFQVYMTISYNGDFQGFERAADDDANDLKMEDIDKHIGSCTPTLFHNGCDLTETVGIDLSEEEVRAKAATGLQIKVYAHSGNSAILTISPEKLQAALLTANQGLPDERKWSLASAAAVPVSENVHAPTAPVDFGSWTPSGAVSFKTSLPDGQAAKEISGALTAGGWRVLKSTDTEILTDARRIAFTPKEADCGTALGISYLADKRTVTIAYLDVTVSDGVVTTRAAIAGKMDLGKMLFTNQDMGAKQLQCRLVGDAFARGAVVAPPAPAQPSSNGRLALGINYAVRPDGAIVVATVVPGSVADKAGIKQLDIIQLIGTEPVQNIDQMTGALGRIVPTQAVEATIVRAGVVQKVTLQF